MVVEGTKKRKKSKRQDIGLTGKSNVHTKCDNTQQDIHLTHMHLTYLTYTGF